MPKEGIANAPRTGKARDQVKELVLKNSEWVRGTGSGVLARLLSSEGMEDRYGYCCLGIYCRDVKYKAPGWLLERGYPSSAGVILIPTHDNMRLQLTIGGINDDSTLSDEDRLTMLEPLFNQFGITLRYDPNG